MTKLLRRIILFLVFSTDIPEVYNSFCLLVGPKQEVKPKLPAGHPMPPSGQAVTSKCPFLAAEMGQRNSSVVRQVGMEFQEDVQEVRTVQKGKCCLESDQVMRFLPFILYRIQCYFVFSFVDHFQKCPLPSWRSRPWPVPLREAEGSRLI